MDTRTVRAGFGEANFTPRSGGWMGGFAARTEPATGTHDPLLLQVLAVHQGDWSSVLVVIDLVSLEQDLTRPITLEVANVLGVDPLTVTVQATHTHSGRVTTESFGPIDPGLKPQLLSAARTAAATCIAATEVVQVRVGQAECQGIAHNRRRGESLTDPVVRVVAFEANDGTPMCSVASFACHPVVLGPNNLLFSADWPGSLRAELSHRTRAPVMFVQGCCGQINTGHSARASMDQPASTTPDRTFSEAERIGTAGARTAERALARLQPGSPNHYGVGVDRQPVELLFMDDAGPSEWSCVTIHRWDTARLVCLPCEPFIELAVDLRTASGDKDLIVAGYCDQVTGYLPYPPRHYKHGRHEIAEAHLYYGRPSALSPQTGLNVRDTAIALLKLHHSRTT